MSPLNSPHISSPGARPAGSRDEADAARQVREMFSRIAPRYDLLNHLLSFQLDRLWRRRAVRRFRHILSRPEAHVLDLCCGTGDLTLALKRGGQAMVFGSDFAHPMLVRALDKAACEAGKRQPKGGSRSPSAPSGTVTSDEARSGSASAPGMRRPGYAEADALQLPFPDASFDLATAAFGFRNLANYERGLREIYRVLRPGGEVGILEFSEPHGALFGPLFRFYFTRILPRLGGAISGNAAAYSYLPSSVESFPPPQELAVAMSRAGFADVRFELWSGGSVALHIARR